MNHRACRLAAAALMSLAGAMPVQAASSASSAASDSLATSVGSVSTSLGNSSNSSSRAAATADGDYRIIDIAAAPDRPGIVRLKLQTVADDATQGEFLLYVPQQVAEQTRLAQGGVVTAQSRPYGTEFAYGPAHRAFFLVLSDDWYRELQTNVVQM